MRTTQTVPTLVKNKHICVRDMKTKVEMVPRMKTDDAFKEHQQRGAFDEHILKYFGEYFPAREGGDLKMCEMVSGDKCFMDVCRMLLGFPEDEGTVDELAEGMVSAGKTFSIGQVERLLDRFNAGEKNIELNEVGCFNLFILDDERGVMELLCINWLGRAWKIGNDPRLLVNSIPARSRLFLRN